MTNQAQEIAPVILRVSFKSHSNSDSEAPALLRAPWPLSCDKAQPRHPGNPRELLVALLQKSRRDASENSQMLESDLFY